MGCFDMLIVFISDFLLSPIISAKTIQNWPGMSHNHHSLKYLLAPGEKEVKVHTTLPLSETIHQFQVVLWN